jgi:hypothetical protein
MSPLLIQYLGWSATAVFVGSYFFARPSLLRVVQMFGALLWIAYGLLIHASPVIVANVLVFAAAAWTTFRTARRACLSPLPGRMAGQCDAHGK